MKRLLLIACVTLLTLHAQLAQAQPEKEAQVRQFVRDHSRGEVPLLEARALGREAIPTLQRILSDPNEKSLWDSAIWTVGFVGSEGSYPVIHDFIWKRFSGAIDDSTMGVIVHGVAALGGIPEQAFPGIHRELALATEPSYWSSLPWTCRTSNRSRDMSLATVAAYALQWTGSAVADSVFNAIAKAGDPLLDKDTIQECLSNNARVRTLTVEGFAKARADSIAAANRKK